MTRASALVGMLCGAVSLVGGILGFARAGSTASLIAGGVAGILLLITGMLTWRRIGWAQMVMSLVGLALLGRFLPVYFKTYAVWPALVLVALGSFTFGLGILGFLLDRYPAPRAGSGGGV